jgi:hypothetical protein
LRYANFYGPGTGFDINGDVVETSAGSRSRASRRPASNATGWRPASLPPAKGTTSIGWSTCSLVMPPSMAMAARRELA